MFNSTSYSSKLTTKTNINATSGNMVKSCDESVIQILHHNSSLADSMLKNVEPSYPIRNHSGYNTYKPVTVLQVMILPEGNLLVEYILHGGE